MLTDEQWDILYTASIENRKDISWMRKAMDVHTKGIDECRERVNDLEVNQGVQRGKVVFLAGTITAVLTILTNAGFWVYSHIGGVK